MTCLKFHGPVVNLPIIQREGLSDDRPSPVFAFVSVFFLHNDLITSFFITDILFYFFITTIKKQNTNRLNYETFHYGPTQRHWNVSVVMHIYL